MYTSIFVLALIVPTAAEEFSPRLKWQENYRTAQKTGREQDKPLAVFIGSGPMNWNNFIEEGNLSEKTQKALTDGYVCVYVDRDQAAGMKLAQQFDVPTGTGLVFSTRDGKGQAFFHSGKLSAAEFQTRLTRYVETEAVATTETLNDSRASFSYNPTTNSPLLRGTMLAPAMTRPYPGSFAAPATFGGNFGSSFRGSVGGGCPNCRR